MAERERDIGIVKKLAHVLGSHGFQDRSKSEDLGEQHAETTSRVPTGLFDGCTTRHTMQHARNSRQYEAEGMEDGAIHSMK